MDAPFCLWLTSVLHAMIFALSWSLPAVIFLLVAAKLYIVTRTGKCHSRRLLTGKTVIITGGNRGLGKATAQEFAARNAKVILACRSLERGQRAAEEITAATNNPKIVAKALDLSSLKSIRSFVEDILATMPNIDILINNAGKTTEMFRKLTYDGLELTMASNYFGHFLLTNLLLDLLKQNAPSTIVNVSSVYHCLAKLNFNNLQGEIEYDHHAVYGTSKLCQILFTRELARRLKGTDVTVNAVHPGIVRTDILDHVPGAWGLFYRIFFWLFGKSAAEGAEVVVHAAIVAAPSGMSGEYLSECRKGWCTTAAKDMDKAVELWKISEQAVGLA